MKLADYAAISARHILVYGAPKSGKTVAVAQLAKKYRLWWVDLEDGIKSVLNPAVLDPSALANIELISIPDRQTYPMAIETILKIVKGGAQNVCHAHGKANCPQCKTPDLFTSVDLSKFDNTHDILVIDSWSQLSESAMNYIMKTAISQDNFDAKAGWDEYGKQGRILERIGSWLQTAPINVVVISHELMVEMEDKTKKIVPIGGTSNFSKTFAKYFDDVVYTEVINKQHRCISSTIAKPSVLAGSRAGVEIGAGETLLKLFGA
jgi:hypothetical protein